MPLRTKSNWVHNDQVLPFLGEQLYNGSLLVVLGAGVSRFYGLPNWEELLDTLSKSSPHGFVDKGSLSLESWAEKICTIGFKNNSDAYIDAVGASLYNDIAIDVDVDKVINNKTLRAIGTLCAQSRRGHVDSVITFNYDNLLETYFQFHGIDALTVWGENEVHRAADIRVYHPHGYLPHSTSGESRSENIVITRRDYQNAVSSGWQRTLTHLLSTRFVLFVGLSGADDRLSQLVLEAKSINPYVNSATPIQYFGVRICSTGDEYIDEWESRGVFCKQFDDLGEGIPKYLFDICRHAAEYRGRLELGSRPYHSGT